MKKFYVGFMSLLLAVAVLTGCGQQNAEQTPGSNEEVTEEVVVVTISQDKGETVIAEKEITFEEGATLMDVLEENFEIEQTDGFITSINGVEQNADDGVYWLYDVNGEMPTVGANEYELQPGDEIVFDLQAT